MTKRPSDGRTRFPQLKECAHFHYDLVELDPIQVGIVKQALWQYFRDVFTRLLHSQSVAFTFSIHIQSVCECENMFIGVNCSR